MYEECRLVYLIPQYPYVRGVQARVFDQARSVRVHAEFPLHPATPSSSSHWHGEWFRVRPQPEHPASDRAISDTRARANWQGALGLAHTALACCERECRDGLRGFISCS
eukprot:1757870-Rhodomonas_salina.1